MVAVYDPEKLEEAEQTSTAIPPSDEVLSHAEKMGQPATTSDVSQSASGTADKGAVSPAATSHADKALTGAAKLGGAWSLARIYSTTLGNKKKKAGAGALITTILVFLTLTLTSGPFQFIHFAQLLQQFHLAGQENASDDRVSKLYRFIKSGGRANETRVGAIGSRMAKSIETQFNKAGFKPVYDGVGDSMTKVVVDRTSPESPFKGLNDADLERLFASEGVAYKKVPGSYELPMKTGIFERNGPTLKFLLKSTGSYKFATAIQAHVFGKWAGVTWHPLRAIDAKINDKLSLAEYWRTLREKYAKLIGLGAGPADILTDPRRQAEPVNPCAVPSDPGCTTKAYNDYLAKKAAVDAYNTKIDAYNADQLAQGNDPLKKGLAEVASNEGNAFKYQGRVATTIRNSLGGAGVKNSFLATAALCLINSMNNIYEKIKYDRMILPLMRVAWHAITLGNQLMNGTDGDTNQLGAYNQLFYDDKTGESWLNSATMQGELGQPQTTQSKKQSTQIKNLGFINQSSPLKPIIDAANGIIKPITGGTLSDGVGAICSTAGQALTLVATVVIAIASFGSSTFAEEIATALFQGVLFSYATQAAMNIFVALETGTAVNPWETGPNFANSANYGSRLAASSIGISHGGTALSAGDSGALKTAIDNEANREFRSKSLAYKLLSPDDPKSVFAKVLDSQAPTVYGNVTKISHSFLGLGKIFSVIPNLFAPKAHAATATGYNYGFPEYGFSINDLNDPAVEDPYANAKDVVTRILPANNWPGRIKNCFGVTISQQLLGGSGPDANTMVWTAVNSADIPNPYNLTDVGKQDNYNNKDNNCADTTEDWKKVRFFIFDSTMMDSASCFIEDDAQSCSNVGTSNSASSSGSGGGGSFSCSDTNNGIDQSPGVLRTEDQKYAPLIAAQAPGRSCPGSVTYPNAIPNDPTKEYFASCNDSNVCNIYTDSKGQYIRVKYRNPPLTGDTRFVYLNGTSTPPTTPPTSPGCPTGYTGTPPNCLPPGCGYNNHFRTWPEFGNLFTPKFFYGRIIC